MSEISQHPEFVPEWDVYRDADGNAVTVDCNYGHYTGPDLHPEQIAAVRHAVQVWLSVCHSEHSDQSVGVPLDGTVEWRANPNVAKSRLLGRLIHDGLPPTKTKPPMAMGGPAWELLPGGDPFQ